MNLWQKIMVGLEEGLTTIGEKTAEMSKLAKLRWEQRGIQKDIHQELKELGKTVYQHHFEKTQDQLHADIKENMLKLKNLEKSLQEKEHDINELTSKVDSQQIRGFKKDLEQGDSTIEQIVIEDNSNLVGKKIMELNLPEDILIGTVLRNDQVIIPDGQTVLKKQDKVTLIGKKHNMSSAMNHFNKK